MRPSTAKNSQWAARKNYFHEIRESLPFLSTLAFFVQMNIEKTSRKSRCLLGAPLFRLAFQAAWWMIGG